jgi:hypothetical protein
MGIMVMTLAVRFKERNIVERSNPWIVDSNPTRGINVCDPSVFAVAFAEKECKCIGRTPDFGLWFSVAQWSDASLRALDW